MSSSNCCFLSCIQVSQEAGKVAWDSHLFKNIPQFVVIHRVKGFSIVNQSFRWFWKTWENNHRNALCIVQTIVSALKVSLLIGIFADSLCHGKWWLILRFCPWVFADIKILVMWWLMCPAIKVAIKWSRMMWETFILSGIKKKCSFENPAHVSFNKRTSSFSFYMLKTFSKEKTYT